MGVRDPRRRCGPNGRTPNNVGVYNAAVLYGGRPHVFYYDNTGSDLRHGYWNGQFWAFETLDGNGGPNGRTSNDVGTFSSVVLYGGRPHVFYYDEDFGGTLRHGYWNGQFWAFEVLDGNGGPDGRTGHDVGEDTAEILSGGRPQVFYYDRTAGNLRRARYTEVGWVFEHLDGNGFDHGRTLDDVGWYNAAVVSGGLPHVFYYDRTTGDLRHGWLG